MRLVYHYKGEWQLEVEADESVFARKLGGPLFHMGALWNVEVPTVSGWRARVPAGRHSALVAGFEEARAMKTIFHLVPDEHASGLRLGDAGIEVVHRALEGNLALDRVVAELTGIAGALFASGPTERLPNPESPLWKERLPLAVNRRMGPDAPEVRPGARDEAQAAVDGFYAHRFATILNEVATRQRPPREAEAVKPKVEEVTHTFHCDATGAPAAKVSLRMTPNGEWLDLTGFSATSDVTVLVNHNDVRRIHRQLVEGDARALWDLDCALAPFFCSDCNRCYAASQWKIDETSPARVESMVCPKKHRSRMAHR